MALPATDNFDSYDDGVALGDQVDWSNVTGEISVINTGDGEIIPTAGGEETCVRWSSDSFDDDQYSEATYISVTGGGGAIGVAVRAQSGSATYYGLYSDASAGWMFKMVSGSWTQLGSNTGNFDGDTMRLEAQGTTITPYRNGSVESTIGAQTDSAISSGYAGVCGWDIAFDKILDDWEGGELSGGAQDVLPSSIASSEAFGSSSLSVGPVTVGIVGISSVEAFGTAILSTGAIALQPTGITTQEALGTVTIDVGAVELQPSGITSQEAFGAPILDLGISTVGVTSAEVLGTPAISVGEVEVQPSSISSAEAFGASSLTTGEVELLAVGISSSEAFGTSTVATGVITLQPTGISSQENVSSPVLTVGPVEVGPIGITSSEAFGSPIVSTGELTVIAVSIASVEAFGTAQLDLSVDPAGIPSGEVFGSAIVAVGALELQPTGIVSSETFGTAQVSIGEFFISPSGIPTSEQFGSAVVSGGITNILPAGIASVEAFGSTVVSAGVVTISPTGISSGEIFSDDFERAGGGLVPPWSNIVGSGLSIDPAAALVGDYGLAVDFIDNSSRYLIDESPDGEGEYHARFYFDPNSISMADEDAHSIMLGKQEGGATFLFILTFIKLGNKYYVGARALDDAVGYRRTSWYVVNDGPNSIEFIWKTGAGTGLLELWVNGTLVEAITDFENDGQRLGEIRWGPNNIEETTVGTYYLDAFESWGESVGSPQVIPTASVFPNSIDSSEQFGLGSLGLEVRPVSLVSLAQVGTPGVGLTVHPIGVGPATAFGTLSLSTGLVSISPIGIISGESIGAVIVDYGLLEGEVALSDVAVGRVVLSDGSVVYSLVVGDKPQGEVLLGDT